MRNSKMFKNLTNQDFIDLIFDYRNHREWFYKGSRPAVVVFFRDTTDSPSFHSEFGEEIISAFERQIDFYKVDIALELELSQEFGMEESAAVLFIPMRGNPMIQPGRLSGSALKQVIEKRLLLQES